MLTSWFIASMTKSMRIWTWIGRNPASAMPTAAPVIASSERGVPKTRSDPYFSARPRVVPRIAFGSSTSSPNSSTFASRAISWSVASRIASTYDRVLPALSAVDMFIEFFRTWKRTFLRERECVRDLGLDLAIYSAALVSREHAAQAAHLVAVDPGLDFVPAAEPQAEILSGTDVLDPPAGHALE